ncbi:MAG: hypothetical protein AB7F19_07730 [Candidatus Babeliales bacterium]
MTFATDGTLGVKTDETYATTATFPHKLGEVVIADNGQRYMFVLASSAITAFDTVLISNTNTAQPITGALVSSVSGGGKIGFATRGAIASGSAGWVALTGNALTIRVIASTQVTPNIPLYTSDTAGCLSSVTASASHFQVNGVYALSTASGATATSVSAQSVVEPFVRRPIN